jgi:hypothetical protein
MTVKVLLYNISVSSQGSLSGAGFLFFLKSSISIATFDGSTSIIKLLRTNASNPSVSVYDLAILLL